MAEYRITVVSPYTDHMKSAKIARIVAILNQKGGVGKTTTTVNIGSALAADGMKVLLVDLDPQSNLSMHLGHEPDESRADVLALLTDPKVRAKDVIVKARPTMHLIPSTTELALAEGELASQEGMQRRLAEKLESIRSRYDYILIDCPPSLGVLTVNALVASDEVIVPIVPQYLALRGLENLVRTVGMVVQMLNPRLEVGGVILTQFDTQSIHSKEVVAEIERFFEEARQSDGPLRRAQVFRPHVRRNIRLAEAPSFGKTAVEYAPESPGAQDYIRLARALLVSWRALVGTTPATTSDPVVSQ